jgi:hypothetical protein
MPPSGEFKPRKIFVDLLQIVDPKIERHRQNERTT